MLSPGKSEGEASEMGSGEGNDEDEDEEDLGDVDDERPKDSRRTGSKIFHSPLEEDMLGMEDTDGSSASGKEWDGDKEERMPVDDDPVDTDTRSEVDEDDVFSENISHEANSGNESGSSMGEEPETPNLDERATLRQMMADSHKTVIATISEASKADIAKGEAISQQRNSFDALLNARIRLQKGIIAINSIPSRDASSDQDGTIASVISNAEAAALKLWNGLEELRQAIQPNPSPTKKRTSSAESHSTTSAALWDRMQSHEKQSLPARRAALTKWSSRLHPLGGNPGRSTLSGATPAPTPLVAILDQHLATPNRARLVARTQVPRSCAPAQAAARIPSDPTIYDDADFYATLLRELVDRRMTDSTSTAAVGSAMHLNGSKPEDDSSLLQLSRDRKPRRQVDTRASKGRKMRYTVHEKLQNFMAPENRGSWGERQTTELFAGLLGRRKIGLGEDEEGEEADENETRNDGVDMHAVKKKKKVNGDTNHINEEALLMFRH